MTTPTTDDGLPDVDGVEQLCLFELVRRSTFNPPAEPRRSAADWLLNTADSVDSSSVISSSVKEGTQ